MKSIINQIKRLLLLIQIYAVEIHIDGQTECIAQTRDPAMQLEMICARESARRELVRLRGEYTALLPIGVRRTWTIA